jgi:hypothetical protein
MGFAGRAILIAWKGFELDGAERMPSALPLAGVG